ncbi:Orf110 [Heliothis zea nudivirus]|uniref:Orf110 n=1 Tax=Heliothis zea nudivirus 1 TaxID=3116536 RepID=Q8JKK3_9VIRU|nr:Orf110 [Heliothis zea nudivirus]AAN04403.1 Orf110 [Heliothis zea nudivirus]
MQMDKAIYLYSVPPIIIPQMITLIAYISTKKIEFIYKKHTCILFHFMLLLHFIIYYYT